MYRSVLSDVDRRLDEMESCYTLRLARAEARFGSFRTSMEVSPSRRRGAPDVHPGLCCARRFLSVMRRGKDVRRDLVRRVREGITAGHYENDLKLEVALDRLITELRRERRP